MTAHAAGTDAAPAERTAAVHVPTDDGASRLGASDDVAPAGLTMVGGTAPGCVGDACAVPGAEGW